MVLIKKYLESKKNMTLRLKDAQYWLVNGVFFPINYDGVLLRCLGNADANELLVELHNKPIGGNFNGDTTAHKLLRAGYY